MAYDYESMPDLFKILRMFISTRNGNDSPCDKDGFRSEQESNGGRRFLGSAAGAQSPPATVMISPVIKAAPSENR